MNFNDFKFIDIHYHADPDLYTRRLNALEAGQYYQQLQGAVVLKSHLGATSIQATLAQKMGLPVFPSLVLNAITGGIDYRVIIKALAEFKPEIPAKLIVHFPTITGRQYQSKLQRELSTQTLSSVTQEPITLFNDKYHLKQEVLDIVKVANDYPIVLSTGHASQEEVYSLIDACQQYDVKTLLLNQPAHPLVNFSATQLQEIVSNDCVWVEQTLLTYLLGHQGEDDFFKVLSSIPRVIYSSDLGQTSQMEIEAWWNYSQLLFKRFGLSKERIIEICKDNPMQLLQ